jgi:hypothetical protein
MTQDERVQRYVRAISPAHKCEDAGQPSAMCYWSATVRRVMAVADAEQTELREKVTHLREIAIEVTAERDGLRAEVERLTGLVDRMQGTVDASLLVERALTDERAKVARVEALHRQAGTADRPTRWCAECGYGVLWPCSTLVALAGPGPDTTAAKDQCCCPDDICLGIPGESDACGACLALDQEEDCLADQPRTEPHPTQED